MILIYPWLKINKLRLKIQTTNSWEDTEIHFFLDDITSQLNILRRLEFEPDYLEATWAQIFLHHPDTPI